MKCGSCKTEFEGQTVRIVNRMPDFCSEACAQKYLDKEKEWQASLAKELIGVWEDGKQTG